MNWANNETGRVFVYNSFEVAILLLYTDLKQPELEETIEAVLLKHGIFYGKSEVWIESEKLYEVLYEMEV